MKATVAELVQLPGVWRGGELEHAVHSVVATGHPHLDAELPGGGWPMGTLSEVLHDGAGIGEVTFLYGALARAAGGGRLIAWVNAPHLPYAPALAQGGIPLDRCIVVRPAAREDALWAAEQALKSGACGAVMLWMERFAEEYAWLRRLQMAAATGRTMAVLFRSTAAERHSTPSHLRIVLSRDRGVLKARIPKRRGPPLIKALPLLCSPCSPSALEEGFVLSPSALGEGRGEGHPFGERVSKEASCSGSRSSSPTFPSRSPNAPGRVASRL